MNKRLDDSKMGLFEQLSVTPCYLRLYFGETLLANATCFFVLSAEGPVLVTNRHNFTGRNNITGEVLHTQGGIPNNAVVTFQTPGGEVYYHIDLLDQTNPALPSWTEHPTLGESADIVALPVQELANIVNENTGITLADDWHRWGVGSELHVIGFPYGQIGGPFPIWSKGYIASEPDVEIANLPIFLIDCRSRPGQSGSPVYAQFKRGDIVEHKGETYAAKNVMNYFVGIYSGRLRSDSDLGFVWKRSSIEELVNHAIVNGNQHQMARRRIRFTLTGSKPYSLNRLIDDVGEI